MNKLGQTHNTQAARRCSALVHPAVLFAYFALLVLAVMTQMQPVLVVLAWVLLFAQGMFLRGTKQLLKSMRWQLPLVLLIALANPLFSAAGSTELCRIGLRAIYAESLVFGACMGLMLSSMFMAFANAGSVISRDAVLQLFGGVLPTIGLMISMIMGLVPRLLRQSAQVNAVQAACTSAQLATGKPSSHTALGMLQKAKRPQAAANTFGSRAQYKQHLRLLTVLMSWSLENSLNTADAMKARGWGAVRKRSTYSRQHFEVFDAALLLVVLICAAAVMLAAYVVCSGFTFYPCIDGWVKPFWYLPFVVYCTLPFALAALLRLREAA